jgi:hypothetical protein
MNSSYFSLQLFLLWGLMGWVYIPFQFRSLCFFLMNIIAFLFKYLIYIFS